MELEKAAILLFTGIFAGFINVVAGGGSLLTLPVFIFLGFDSTVANATNRVAILFQNMAAIYGFQKKGVSSFPYSIWLGIVALLGAILGAWMAMRIDDQLFNKVLAIVMLGVSVFIIFNPLKKISLGEGVFSKTRMILALMAFFFIGVYGGFIQAGVGILIIAAISIINQMNLVKINSIKVVVVFMFTIVALIIFIINDLILWKYGLALAVGQATGGLIGSYWSVKNGDIWIRRVLIVMILFMALKLLGVPFLNP